MGHLPPKKRARPAETFLEKTVKKAPSTKKPKIVRVVSSESDSSDSESESEIDDDEEEVIEEITTGINIFHENRNYSIPDPKIFKTFPNF